MRNAASPPRIVITVAVADRQPEPELATRRNALYAAAIARHGGEPVVLDAATDAGVRAKALAGMDGLLISGGADLHPERYGREDRGSPTVERDRDALEHEAWTAAQARGLPVLGICRGFQAINVFSGGALLQHVDGHQGPRWGKGPALDPSAARRARHAARPHPLPDQCRRRRGPRQLVPSPGGPSR